MKKAAGNAKRPVVRERVGLDLKMGSGVELMSCLFELRAAKVHVPSSAPHQASLFAMHIKTQICCQKTYTS